MHGSISTGKGFDRTGSCCAGALKDNGRASVIGDSATYGKGKIQSVYELADGSALFVTIARYKTPVRI